MTKRKIKSQLLSEYRRLYIELDMEIVIDMDCGSEFIQFWNPTSSISKEMIEAIKNIENLERKLTQKK